MSLYIYSRQERTRTGVSSGEKIKGENKFGRHMLGTYLAPGVERKGKAVNDSEV